MKHVRVNWIDAVMEDGYLDIEGVKSLQPAARINVGFLVCEDEYCIKLSSGLVDDKYDDTFVIPKGVIISIDNFEVDDE